jgi:hypothetical protein
VPKLLPKRVWTQSTLREEKDLIRAELQKVEKEGGPEARLARAWESVSRLEKESTARGQLRRYIFAMSALVAHERSGGLSPLQVRRLIEVARAILTVNGIPTENSPLAVLYKELEQVASQIARRQGQHWKALWTQHLAIDALQLEEASAQESLGLAIRWHRLGLIGYALQGYEAARSKGLPAVLAMRARIGRLIALRLAGDFGSALQEADAVLADPVLSPDLRREVTWQRLCAEAQSSEDLSSLAVATLRGREHFGSEYRIEAFLWIRSVSNKRWMARLPSLEYLPKLHGQSKRDPEYRIALTLEQAYDGSLPMHRRLRRLGEALELAASLTNLETEMLVWTAAARWLARSRRPMLASVCLRQYEALCLRSTNGRSADVLGVVADLMAKPWYRSFEPVPLAQAQAA